jgi:hypothetical protein
VTSRGPPGSPVGARSALGYLSAVPQAPVPATEGGAAVASDTVAPRPLRILFVMQRVTLDRFVLLLPGLARRGHRIHIGFNSRRGFDPLSDPRLPSKAIPHRAQRILDELQATFPAVTYDIAPARSDSDGWRQTAWLVRGIADLAHHTSPRFAEAKALRRRTRKRVVSQLKKAKEIEPLGRRLGLRLARRLTGGMDGGRSRRMIRLARRLEYAVPSSAEVEDYVRRFDPDIVLVSGTYRHVSEEVEYLKSARRLGIPSGVVVPSWDNLTNHGSLKFAPERVFVWNDVQVRDAVELHDMPADRVRATGAHVFDDWFELRPSRDRTAFAEEVGLDPARPYLVYLCSSPNIVAGDESEFVRGWVDALRVSGDERLRTIGLLVRPHPNPLGVPWDGVELGENTAIWPRRGAHPALDNGRADLFDTIFHSVGVVGINTTAMIEAAILGKSVSTILVPEFAQESTLHFRYLLAENGGFLQVASSLPEHVEQLRFVLDEDELGAERRRRFVASFVRPGGLDRSATELGVSAIEELVDVPVDRTSPRGTRLLRLVLATEARLSAAYWRGRGE